MERKDLVVIYEHIAQEDPQLDVHSNPGHVMGKRDI